MIEVYLTEVYFDKRGFFIELASRSGDVEAGRAGLLDGGGGEGDLRVLVHREEVVAAQVAVALLVAGVDAGGLDGQLRGGLGEVVGVDDGAALELVELAADLGDHRVAGHEPDAGVGLVATFSEISFVMTKPAV